MKEVVGSIILGGFFIAVMFASTVDGRRQMNKLLYNKCIQQHSSFSVIEAEKQCKWIKEEN